jgi:hypothetical protein
MLKTNSLREIEIENILDPRLECMSYAQRNQKWGVIKQTESQTFVNTNASSYSQSGVTWNLNTQGLNTLIDRKFYVQMQFLVTFTGTAPIGATLLSDETIAPRAFPLMAISNNVNVTINGTAVGTQYNDAMHALLRYQNDYKLSNYDLSMTPSTLDNFQNYADAVGSVRNPLSSYVNGSYTLGRGSFKLDNLVNPISVSAVTPIVATMLFTVTEPLFISPLLYAASDPESGFINVQNLSVQLTFDAAQLARVVSYTPAVGIAVSSVVASVGQNTTAPPQLLINYLNPPVVDVGLVPKFATYQYDQVEVYVNNMNQTLASNNSQTFTNNAIQLSTVPKAIYIYACIPNSAKTHLTSDTFFGINSISLQYLNSAGQLSTMNRQELYSMCVKNGLTGMSYPEWAGLTQNYAANTVVGLTGSVLKITPEDLNIPTNLASGVNYQSQLIYNLNVTNINQLSTQGVQIVTVVITDGLLSINPSNTVTQIGIIDETDVIKVRQTGKWVTLKHAQSMYGGNLFGKIKSYGKDLIGKVSKVCDAVNVGKKIIGMGAETGGELMIDTGNYETTGGRLLGRTDLRSRMRM